MSAKDRKGSGDKRKNNGNALAGTLFTAAMICCCVLIYLLSRGGRNTAKDTSMEIPPQPTAQMERVYPSVEVFFERAKGYGFDAEYTENDGETLDEQFEKMTGAKRTTVRIVSALLLLLIVAGVVFGTDAIMNFIKEFFG